MRVAYEVCFLCCRDFRWETRNVRISTCSIEVSMWSIEMQVRGPLRYALIGAIYRPHGDVVQSLIRRNRSAIVLKYFRLTIRSKFG
jgi:hypothetical protein